MKSKLLVLFIVLGIFVFLAFNAYSLWVYSNQESEFVGVPLFFGYYQLGQHGFLDVPTYHFVIENLIADLLFAFVISGIVIYSTLRFSK